MSSSSSSGSFEPTEENLFFKFFFDLSLFNYFSLSFAEVTETETPVMPAIPLLLIALFDVWKSSLNIYDSPLIPLLSALMVRVSEPGVYWPLLLLCLLDLGDSGFAIGTTPIMFVIEGITGPVPLLFSIFWVSPSLLAASD